MNPSLALAGGVFCAFMCIGALISMLDRMLGDDLWSALGYGFSGALFAALAMFAFVVAGFAWGA